MRRVRAAALLGLAALATGCASRSAVRVEAVPDRPVAARVALVYPYAFRWDETPVRGYAKAMDVVLSLVAKERLLVFGPGDYQLVRPGDPDPSVGTDVVRILLARGLDPRGFLAWRGWAERRVARGMAVVEGKGRTLAASSEEVTYVAHLQVWDGAAGRTVVEVSGSAQALPPGDRPEHDPADARPRRQEGEGVGSPSARALRVEAERGARPPQLRDAALQAALVQRALPPVPEEGREHAHARHEQVQQRTQRVVIEELGADREEEPLADARAAQHPHEAEEVEEGAVVDDEHQRGVAGHAPERLATVEAHAAAEPQPQQEAHRGVAPPPRHEAEAPREHVAEPPAEPFGSGEQIGPLGCRAPLASHPRCP
jgi:hypothetical protein